jgi:ATP-dependent Zn protease
LTEAQRLLEENRSRLDALAAALLKEDSLDESEIHRVTGLAPREPEVAATMAVDRPRV